MASVISLLADWPGTGGERWSTITTVDRQRKGGGGGVLPRQQRHCVKHSRHGDWRVSLCRNELPQYASLYVTVSCSLTWMCLKTINAPAVQCECALSVHCECAVVYTLCLQHVCWAPTLYCDFLLHLFSCVCDYAGFVCVLSSVYVGVHVILSQCLCHCSYLAQIPVRTELLFSASVVKQQRTGGKRQL